MATEIINYDFKSGLAQEIELVDIEELYKRSEKIITSRHRAGFYVILYIEAGNGRHFVDYNQIELHPKTLYFFHKDIVQQFDKGPSELKGKAILFTDTFFSESEQDSKFLKTTGLFNHLLDISSVQQVEVLDYFKVTFGQIDHELKNERDVAQKIILKNLLQNLLLLAEREIKSDVGSNCNNIELSHVILFKNRLEIDFRENRSVSFYSLEIGLTEKRLNLATKKILGKTAKEVIDDRVVLEIKRLLVNTAESVKEIGFLLGFDEPTYFIHYFKKHTSTTPVEFREKYAWA